MKEPKSKSQTGPLLSNLIMGTKVVIYYGFMALQCRISLNLESHQWIALSSCTKCNFRQIDLVIGLFCKLHHDLISAQKRSPNY